jgi:hypothetical protein
VTTARSRGHKLLLGPKALRKLLQLLGEANVSSFSYEDAKVKFRIKRSKSQEHGTRARKSE